MPHWTIKRTDTFLKYLKKHKNNNELFTEIDKKIKRIKENPFIIGGNLSGKMYGLKSTRLVKNFRLIFSIDDKNQTVYLEAVDHRKNAY